MSLKKNKHESKEEHKYRDNECKYLQREHIYLKRVTSMFGTCDAHASAHADTGNTVCNEATL